MTPKIKVTQFNEVKHYSVGFLFNDTKTKVCLIKKNRPTWQEGFLNGVGGHLGIFPH